MAPKKDDKKWKDFNILLLGESGVGKTTFINSFANYVEYKDLKTALNNKVMCLIPSSFSIPDEDFEEQIVQIGNKDANEDMAVGNSSTQGTRSYVFPVKKDQRVRLIDTPGIGDVRGLDQDKINFENILDYISRFKHLHAICFLLKPDVSRLNVYFNFCIMHLLSRLDRSAVKNIIFVFTNTRKGFYRPGDSLGVLRKLLEDIKKDSGVTVPCEKDNIFCYDNEAFRFLAAVKQGIHFGNREKDDFSASWRNSAESCWKMLTYIMGDLKQTALEPHIIENTLSVNNARRIIIDLSKPLADISDFIDDNLTVIGRHQQMLQTMFMDVKTLKEQLYVPGVSLKQTSLTQPVTVCTAAQCSEVYTFMGMKKYHYKQRCHNPCYLTNVPVEIAGSPELRGCAAMRLDQCTQCTCNFQTHMHVSYQTELIEEKQVDPTVGNRIKSNEDAIKEKNKMIDTLSIRAQEFGTEKVKISKAMAKFAYFLFEHSISTYNDAFLEYIDYLIDRENGLGEYKDKLIVQRLENQKKQYLEEKKILVKAKKSLGDSKVDLISPSEINECVKELYNLKHSGKTISQLHKKQEKERYKQVEANTEYCHPKSIGKSADDDGMADLAEALKKAGMSDNEELMELVRKKIDEKAKKNTNTGKARGNFANVNQDQRNYNNQQQQNKRNNSGSQKYDPHVPMRRMPPPLMGMPQTMYEYNQPFAGPHSTQYSQPFKGGPPPPLFHWSPPDQQQRPYYQHNDLQKHSNINQSYNQNIAGPGPSNQPYGTGQHFQPRHSAGRGAGNQYRGRGGGHQNRGSGNQNRGRGGRSNFKQQATKKNTNQKGALSKNKSDSDSDYETVDNSQQVAAEVMKSFLEQSKKDPKKGETLFMFVKK